MARTMCACLMLALAGAALAQVPLAPKLDPLPHELRPEDWPQPDYYTEALKLTRFKPGERWRVLKLTPGLTPDVLVLPVQMQVFGWTPAFAAMLGARLDREIAARGIDANRQTDLFDADGPYARRFSDAEIAAFVAPHTKSQVLALYIGRDGAGANFVTLSLWRAGQRLRAHRRFAEVAQPNAALDTFSSHLPAMLDELQLGAGKTSAAAEPARRCDEGDWVLADLKPGAARAARACRAIVIGTLLPEFEWETTYNPRPKTADKLPWLAEAWVEADALLPESSAAVRAVAWSQMELTPSYEAVSTAVDVGDPVVRALARGLWAHMRTRRMPIADRRAAQEDYTASAASALPPFVRAALTERSAYPQQFRQVDLCSLEMALPSMRTPAECAGTATAGRTRSATRAERNLLEAWRVARAFKDLRIEGEDRGNPKRRQAVLDTMPARVAAHPLVRMERFRSEHFDAQTGSFEALVRRADSATADFVQAAAELQRLSSMLSDNAVYRGDWTRNEALLHERRIKSIAEEDDRLMTVLGLDGFVSRTFPMGMRATHAIVNLLRPGPLWRSVDWPPPTGPPPGEPPPRAVGIDLRPGPAMPSSGPPPDPFGNFARIPGWQEPPAIERAAEVDPQDLAARSTLAALRLKTGHSVAQARALIDAAVDDKRADAAIGESHRWAHPAHLFFFAGEPEAARYYYAKVVQIGSYSGSDLHARVRVRLLAGDIGGALKASQDRLARYQDDFARRDIAGYEFMRGHPAQAWAALTPRLGLSDQLELWAGAMVGQRMDGKSAREVQDWIAKSSYGQARIGGVDMGALHVLRFMTDDRTPTADDLSLLNEVAQRQVAWAPPGTVGNLRALVLLKKLATAPQVAAADVQAVRALLEPTSDWRNRGALMPLYAWVAWRASGGKDTSLAPLRAAELSAEFDALLAKGVLSGLDGQPDVALRYLRAARYDLINTIGPWRRDLRSAPYTAAFVAWLLFGHTHDTRYRDEALLLAQTHQRTFPFLAWPYALDALLARDGPARTVAACRAAFLDRGSLFLTASGLRPDPASPACRKALW